MKQGYLSQYFKGVALKRLSVVEADIIRSNQHEYHGTGELREILGEPDGKVRFTASFLYLTDQDGEPIVEDGFLTLYPARRNARRRGVKRPEEYRLYFSNNSVSQCAAAGDLLVIARKPDDTLLVIVVEKDTTTEQQIMWLFGFSSLSHPGFSVKSELETEQDRIDFAARVVLEQIGVELQEEAPDYLGQMLTKFNGMFPKAIDFSVYARSTIRDLSSRDDPDAALIAWMEREEILFRTLENHIMGGKLSRLAEESPECTESFIRLVKSTPQRRKSRAGLALENHLEHVFIEHGITCTRSGVTENNLKPDFIFPGITCYHDLRFPQTKLTMLAAKLTCKDRWRQILNEAARISQKHLLTLEPSISENQTREMRTEKIQLILPRRLHKTCTITQQGWLMDVAAFIRLVRQHQISS